MTSLYDLTVPAFRRGFASLSAILTAGEKYARDHDIAEAVQAEAKFSGPDMLVLLRISPTGLNGALHVFRQGCERNLVVRERPCHAANTRHSFQARAAVKRRCRPAFFKQSPSHSAALSVSVASVFEHVSTFPDHTAGGKDDIVFAQISPPRDHADPLRSRQRPPP